MSSDSSGSTPQVDRTLPSRNSHDPGGVAALLSDARTRLTMSPSTDSPVVALGRCHHAVAAIGAASRVVADLAISAPPSYSTTALQCDLLIDDVEAALRAVLSTDRPALAHPRLATSDPVLRSRGPNIPMVRTLLILLATELRVHATALAASPGVASEIRRAAEATADAAALITTETL
ncbi:hypothetical protein ACFVAV_18330 [Nocardia sp. NPDC057663]|uniref:hypothetical protein n=1 Tax=Nocardia sp. NPDC057663 TaxID=3346201 RepID=UPI0036701211